MKTMIKRMLQMWVLCIFLVTDLTAAMETQQGTVIIRDRNSNTQAEVNTANELLVSIGSVVATSLDVNLIEIGGTTITVAAALADTTAVPTTGLFGAMPFVYDRAVGDYNRADAGSDDALSGDNLPAFASMTFDTAAGDWNRTQEASADSLASLGIPAMGPLAYDRAANDWNRIDAAADDSLVGDNLQGTVALIRDTTAGNFNRPIAGDADGADETTIPLTMIGVYDRAAGDVNRADAAADNGLDGDNLLATGGMVYDAGEDDWSRIVQPSNTGSGIGPEGLLAFVAHVFDGVGNFDPVGSASNVGDANSASNAAAVSGRAFNGNDFDRLRSADLTNMEVSTTLTSRNSIGALQMERGSRWGVSVTASVGAASVTTIAAESGVRHIADCVSFSAGSTSAPALTLLTVNLRDGATGAGSIIWSQTVVVPNSTGQNVEPFGLCGLGLVGTTNTAMTLEFSAGLANLFQSTSLTGYNVN
jgi:hypothetical protein